jgi:3-phenylpropionate/cinnamic acid dioxygenase small subunit
MDPQTVSDKIEIHELLARYARGLDTKDWELWKSVFTPDSVIDYRSAGGILGSRYEVAAWLEAALAAFPMTQHFITNVEVDLDGDRATARALFFNPLQLAGMAEQSSCGGTYFHRLVRTADGWRSEELTEQSLWFVNPPRGSGG